MPAPAGSGVVRKLAAGGKMLKDLLVNGVVKPLTNRHRPGKAPDVFLLATPRGGSTWLMEMIWSQPGFRSCNEPLDLRNPMVRRHLGIDRWEELYSQAARAKLFDYFDRLVAGRLYVVDPLPLRGRYHRFRTDRMVFKLLHGAEDQVGALARRVGGKVVLLLRHPVPVSLSRRHLPRLEAFFSSDYALHFDERQLSEARQIVSRGSDLERAVVDWCFQNAVPLSQAGDEWLVVSYEQLVLEPELVIDRLARFLELPRVEAMRAHVTRASAVTSQSDEEAKRLLTRSEDGRRLELITRWQRKVDEAQVEAVQRVLDLFGIDAYRAADTRPARRYWLAGEESPFDGARAGSAEATPRPWR